MPLGLSLRMIVNVTTHDRLIGSSVNRDRNQRVALSSALGIMAPFGCNLSPPSVC
jgi:hypothetical protein